MEKTIKIGKKSFQMASSAYTQFKYKNDTGKSLIQDLSNIQKKYRKILEGQVSNDTLYQVEEIIDMIFRIAYIMTNEKDKSQAQNYEDFLKQLDNYYEDLTWINEIVELALSPFSRRVQTN